MRIGLDTNVLIQAHLPSLDRHELAREYLCEQLDLADTTLAVTAATLLTHGVHRLTTFNTADFAVFESPDASEPRLGSP